MMLRKSLSSLAVGAVIAFSTVAAPSMANAAAPAPASVQNQAPKGMNPNTPATKQDLPGMNKQIKCTYNGAVTTCQVYAPGGYCGSSRGVGVGITTGKKGGIWLRVPLQKHLTWNAGKVANHNIYVGQTFNAVVTVNGKISGTENPYISCSLA